MINARKGPAPPSIPIRGRQSVRASQGQGKCFREQLLPGLSMEHLPVLHPDSPPRLSSARPGGRRRPGGCCGRRSALRCARQRRKARSAHEGKSHSFLHISQARDRPAPRHQSLTPPSVYARRCAQPALGSTLVILIRDRWRRTTTSTAFIWAEHVQTGLVVAASVAAYDGDQSNPQTRELTLPRQGRRPRPPDRGAERRDRAGVGGAHVPTPRSAR